MNTYILSTMLTISMCFFMKAQTTDVHIKVTSEHENTPLAQATVYFNDLEKGAVTNAEGIADFSNIPNGDHPITISYLGFETLQTTVKIPSNAMFVFSLENGGHELEEIVIQSIRNARSIEKIPTRIEVIEGEEFQEKLMMNSTNISMVLRESTGIQMQQTSLSSGNTNIRIQGLDGRYTQLLRDGFPLFGGFSSGLSIMQIPPVDLKQFEIIKGSSSVLYGGGAIAGLVNLISKTPEDEPALDIMLTQTQALGSTANVFYSKRKGKFGMSLYGSGNYQKAYDPDDDNFTNLPKTQSVTFNPKFYYYPSDKSTLMLGFNGVYDDREGGDISVIEDDVSEEHQYTEENVTKRVSSQLAYDTKIDSISSLSIKNSVSFFDRNLTIPDLNFDGKQVNTFTELNYNKNLSRTDWSFGANLYTSDFDENDAATIQRDQNDVTYGVFVNNTYDISDNWILESGFRADYNNDFGFFPLPKVSLLYKSGHGISSRIGGGLGYKIPDIFTEEAEFINYENVLAIDKSTIDAERSYGANFDVNYETKLFNTIGFSVNQLFYVTAIDNSLLLNSTDDGFFKFENAPDKILSKGAETNIKFAYKDFKWFLNYALIDSKLNYLDGNPQKPLTAKHNAGSVLMYETEKWRVGYETYYTGKQFLSDGTKTTDYATMGLLLVRNLKFGSIFINAENFLDVKQTDFTDLVSPPIENPIFSEIYAPTDGFILSLGIIIKPFGNEHHHH